VDTGRPKCKSRKSSITFMSNRMPKMEIDEPNAANQGHSWVFGGWSPKIRSRLDRKSCVWCFVRLKWSKFCRSSPDFSWATGDLGQRPVKSSGRALESGCWAHDPAKFAGRGVVGRKSGRIVAILGVEAVKSAGDPQKLHGERWDSWNRSLRSSGTPGCVEDLTDRAKQAITPSYLGSPDRSQKWGWS